MTKKQFKEIEAKQGTYIALLKLMEESDDLYLLSDMKNIIINNLKDDCWMLAKHLLDCVYDDSWEYDDPIFYYDYSMGTLQNAWSVNNYEDVEDLLDED